MKQKENTNDLNVADHQVVIQMTGDHAQSRPEAVKTEIPPPHKHNTFNRSYVSDTESETEDYKPRHLTVGSFEIHEHYNTTTDDEHSHLDSSSEDEHSPMDY